MNAAGRSIYFCYADPVGFSGQKAAIELLKDGLAKRGWRVRSLPLPVFDRSKEWWDAIPRFIVALVASWLRTLRIIGGRGGWLCVAVGQTHASFVRDLFPMLLGRMFLGRRRIIVPLHSSLFTTWSGGSLISRLFRLLLSQAGTITVLGEIQRSRLIADGIDDHRIAIVVNTCQMEPLQRPAVIAKGIADLERPIRVLHLGSLIDTKGYPEFLEALEIIARRNSIRVESILCGPIVISEFSARFSDLVEAQVWIDAKLSSINSAQSTSVRWIKGAIGEAKNALFRQADIFILPTHYAVEAQPLVLLEAMASGCAIITSCLGEIPTILDSSCAILLTDPTVASVASALENLLSDSELRTSLGIAANERYTARFAVGRHLDRWEFLLNGNLPDL